MNQLTREDALRKALDDWNSRVGTRWALQARWNPDDYANLLKLEELSFDGDLMSDRPGPFKLLGAFFLFYLIAPPYDLFRHDNSPADEAQLEKWLPRVAMWSYRYNYAVVEFAGKPLALPPGFPTYHLFVDFMGYIRSIRRTFSHNPSSAFSKTNIVERISSLALVLEASTYGRQATTPLLSNFTKVADQCLKQLTPEQQWDIDLNDPDYA